jgi:hypothetical protein
LEAQVDRGFAFVSEGACESFLLSREKELPEGGETELHRKTTLALACIAAIKPDMLAEDASKTINQAFLAENPDCYASLHVDEDALCDVLNKGEANKVTEYNVQVQKTKAKKALAMETRDRYVYKYFKKGPAPEYTSAQKKMPRWLPPRDQASTKVITAWIRRHAPADVEILCDDYNGRWRVIAPTLEWRSISWTKRGYEKAACEVIHQAWEYEEDWCGRKPPFSLDELAKRFLEDS